MQRNGLYSDWEIGDMMKRILTLPTIFLFAGFAWAQINNPTGGSGSGMVWPSTAGIPYWTSGTAWGGAYNASTLIPNSYINWVAPGAIGGTTPAAAAFTAVTIP